MLLALLAGCSDYEIVEYDGADIFYQDPASKVDVLLVVDDSCSMQPYQSELSKNFETFLTFFDLAQVDYQVGVTTTDTVSDSAGYIRGDVITPSTPDAAKVFADIVQVGTEGSANEMGIHAAWMALTEPRVSTANAGFLRPDAALSIFFLSDEEDASPLPVNDYARDFNATKGETVRDVFNASALVVTDEGSCPPQAVSVKGDRYIAIAEETNGVLGNLCDEDFTQTVTELSLRASRLMDTFYLSKMPNVGTLEVSVDEEALPCDSGQWTYELVDVNGVETPAVIFELAYLPAPSSQIAIRYKYGDGDPTGFCSVADTGGAE